MTPENRCERQYQHMEKTLKNDVLCKEWSANQND